MSGFALWPSQVVATSLLNSRAFPSLWEILYSPAGEDVKKCVLGGQRSRVWLDSHSSSSVNETTQAPDAEQWTLLAPLTTTPAIHTVAASRGLQRGKLGNRGAESETDPDKLSGCSTGEIAWASDTLVPLST